MKNKELYELIDSLSCDIEFVYQGKSGSVCPFSRDNIAVHYEDMDKTYNNIDDVMNDTVFDGKCLNDICEQIEIM